MKTNPHEKLPVERPLSESVLVLITWKTLQTPSAEFRLETVFYRVQHHSDPF